MQVEIYWNFTRKLWSIRDPYLRKVIRHSETLCIQSPTFTVSEKGRQRVLRERRKNVHARVRGEFMTSDWWKRHCDTQVRYNPYRDASFVTNAGEPVTRADFAIFQADGTVFAAKPSS